MELASENWDADVEAERAARAGAAEGFRPVPNLRSADAEELPGEESNTRCGSRVESQQGAAEVTARTLMAQDQYDAMMRYAKTTRKIEVLMQSISSGARVGYKRSWKHWMSFCRGQNQPV